MDSTMTTPTKPTPEPGQGLETPQSQQPRHYTMVGGHPEEAEKLRDMQVNAGGALDESLSELRVYFANPAAVRSARHFANDHDAMCFTLGYLRAMVDGSRDDINWRAILRGLLEQIDDGRGLSR